MKKQEFKKLIREEVISTLQDVLPALMAEAMVIQQEKAGYFDKPKQNIQEKKTSFKDILEMVDDGDYSNHYTSNQNNPVRYTDNPVLNEILNNTQGGLPQQNQMLPPAYQMAMQQEESSLMSEMSDGGMMIENSNHSFANDFGDKISKFTTPPPQQKTSKIPSQATQHNPNGAMSEQEALAYAESFGGDSDGEISMDFINSIGKKAGQVVKESTKKSANKGFSNIDFTQ